MLELNLGAIGADDQFVPLSRRIATVVALLVASLVGLVATRVAGAQEEHSRVSPQPVPGLATAARSEGTQGAIYRALPRRPEDPESEASRNISVAVPVVPRLQALPGLCTAFLGSAEHAKNGKPFDVLIGATGGTPTATTAWCRTYLTLWQEGKTGQH